MAMKRSQYQRFRRTGGSLASQSSYANTLVRKQQAAEDDYYDNAYSLGAISAEEYIKKLTERTARIYLTPLQKQNLTQKIDEVNRSYQDSLIETAYKTGATYNGEVVDTKYLLDREQKKLDTMLPGSEAYNKQEAKVQSYKVKYDSEVDKQNKDERKQYRLDEMEKLSTMREQTSTEMRQKAQVYEKLQAMAQADGETQEAQQYEIQKNGFNQSADKAEINERIQDVVVKNSTPIDPLSTSAAAGGSATLRSSGGVGSQAGTLPAGGQEQQASTPETSPLDNPEMVEYAGILMDKRVYDELLGKSEVKSYLNRINKYAQYITGDEGKNNGLDVQIANQTDLVNAYKTELANAKGDNKDTLTKGYNDAVERLNNLTAKKDEYMAKIDEEQGGFSEFISKKAATIMKDQDTEFDRDLDKEAKSIQAKFSTGKMDEKTYLSEVYNLYTVATKHNASRQSQYEAVNDAVGMTNAEKKATEFGDKLNFLVNDVKPKIDAGILRVVQSDKDDNETLNLSNMKQGVKKGEFVLVDPTAGAEDQNKAIKEFDNAHIQLAGRWFPVKPNLDKAPADFKQDKSREEWAKKNNDFYYTQIKDGKEEKVAIKSVDYGEGTTRYVPENDIKKFVDRGYFVQKGNQLVRNYDKNVNVPLEAAKNIIKEIPNVPKNFIDMAKNLLSGKKAEPQVQPQQSNMTSFLDQAKRSIVKPVQASEGNVANNWVDQITDAALSAVPEASKEGAKQNIPYIINALDEQGILTPNNLAYALATVQHETAGTFKPIEEYGGRQQAITRGYGGGANYFGRGYIQLTHDYNYKDIGKKIGLGDELYKNPELALKPEIASKILASFMKDRGVTKYSDSGDFYNARRPVNGLDKADKIAGIAKSYASVIPKDLNSIKSMAVASPTPTPKATSGSMQSTPAKQGFLEKVMNFLVPQVKASTSMVSAPAMSYAKKEEPQPIATTTTGQTRYSDNSVKGTPQNQSMSQPQMSMEVKQSTPQMSVAKPASTYKPITTTVSNAVKKVTEVAKPVVQQAKSTASSFIDKAKQAVGNTVNKIKSWFKW